MGLLSGLAVGFATAAAVALATAALLPWLPRWGFIDTPNARSSHHKPTPRAGGLAPVAILLLAMAAAAAATGSLDWPPLIAATLVIAAVGLIDDRRGVSAGIRLGLQALAIAGAVFLVVSAWPAWWPGWAPAAVMLPLIAFGWLWFVNLYNFMDGVDGITGVETTAIGAGAALVAHAAGSAQDQTVAIAGFVLAGAGAGFLVHNWRPAKVFLGDVGSVPLGFLAGALLLALAAAQHPIAALLLPAYHVTDATLTLILRAVRGERLTDGHRSHAYQMALQKSLTADRICLRVSALNGVLIALAVATTAMPSVAQAATLAAGYALALGLWLALRSGR